MRGHRPISYLIHLPMEPIPSRRTINPHHDHQPRQLYRYHRVQARAWGHRPHPSRMVCHRVILRTPRETPAAPHITIPHQNTVKDRRVEVSHSTTCGHLFRYVKPQQASRTSPLLPSIAEVTNQNYSAESRFCHIFQFPCRTENFANIVPLPGRGSFSATFAGLSDRARTSDEQT